MKIPYSHWTIMLLLALSGTFSSCKKVIGTGPALTEIREVGAFNKISLAIDATVKITQDSIQKVEVIGQQNILDELVTKMSGSTLIIMYKPNTAILGKEVLIHISMPTIQSLNVSGSGAILVESPIVVNGLDLMVSGSGNISIPSMTAAQIYTVISGSGEIDIQSGAASSLSSVISGSGDFRAINFQALQVSTKTSGSGTTEVYALEALFAEISGSGNVYYRGSPVVESKISGSGRLIKQ